MFGTLGSRNEGTLRNHEVHWNKFGKFCADPEVNICLPSVESPCGFKVLEDFGTWLLMECDIKSGSNYLGTVHGRLRREGCVDKTDLSWLYLDLLRRFKLAAVATPQKARCILRDEMTSTLLSFIAQLGVRPVVLETLSVLDSVEVGGKRIAYRFVCKSDKVYVKDRIIHLFCACGARTSSCCFTCSMQIPNLPIKRGVLARRCLAAGCTGYSGRRAAICGVDAFLVRKGRSRDELVIPRLHGQFGWNAKKAKLASFVRYAGVPGCSSTDLFWPRRLTGFLLGECYADLA